MAQGSWKSATGVATNALPMRTAPCLVDAPDTSVPLHGSSQ